MADLHVERADFVAVPVQDLKRATEFYGETLGLPQNPNTGPRWIEYELGNVSLALVSPEVMIGAECGKRNALSRLTADR